MADPKDRFCVDRAVSGLKAGLGLVEAEPAGFDWSTVHTLTIGPRTEVARLPGFVAPAESPESLGRALIAAAKLGPIESVEHLPDGAVRFRLQKRARTSNPGGAA